MTSHSTEQSLSLFQRPFSRWTLVSRCQNVGHHFQGQKFKGHLAGVGPVGAYCGGLPHTLFSLSTVTLSWKIKNRKSRKEQIILIRLLIGHTHLTHSYLINEEHPSNCDLCRSPLTVEHILTSCSAYKNIIENITTHSYHTFLSVSLKNIGNKHIQQTLNGQDLDLTFLYGTV